MLTERPWALPAVMRMLLGIFLCLAFVLLSVELAQHFIGRPFDENSPLVMALGTVALDGPILLMIFLFLRIERIGWAEAFGFRSPGLARSLLLGATVAIIFLPVGDQLMKGSLNALDRLHIATSVQQPVQALKNAGGEPTRLLLVFLAVVLAPVAEETLFRGVLYPTLKQCGFPKAAWFGTSFLFALIHANLPTFVPLLVLALVLVLLYEKTNNLLACIVAHATFNAANIAQLYLSEHAANHPPV